MIRRACPIVTPIPPAPQRLLHGSGGAGQDGQAAGGPGGLHRRPRADKDKTVRCGELCGLQMGVVTGLPASPYILRIRLGLSLLFCRSKKIVLLTPFF